MKEKILEMVRSGEVSSVEELEKLGYDLSKIFEDDWKSKRKLNVLFRAQKLKKEEEEELER